MPIAIHHSTELSESARRRWSQHERRPLLLSDWLEAVFIHYEIDARILQRAVPFELDQWEGKAWVSAVAFTMRRLRFARGGKISEWLCRPVATQHFLNLRTYVQDRGEPGIYFLAEWLSSGLSVCLGPPLYGLPARAARLPKRPGARQLARAGDGGAGGLCLRSRIGGRSTGGFGPVRTGVAR